MDSYIKNQFEELKKTNSLTDFARTVDLDKLAEFDNYITGISKDMEEKKSRILFEMKASGFCYMSGLFFEMINKDSFRDISIFAGSLALITLGYETFSYISKYSDTRNAYKISRKRMENNVPNRDNLDDLLTE